MFDITVLTKLSNKTINIVDTSCNQVSTNYSNVSITLPNDNSYVMHIEPTTYLPDFTNSVNIISDIFSGAIGYLWIFVIIIIFYTLLTGVIKHVR